MPFLWFLSLWLMWVDWLNPAREQNQRKEGEVIHVDFKRRRRRR